MDTTYSLIDWVSIDQIISQSKPVSLFSILANIYVKLLNQWIGAEGCLPKVRYCKATIEPALENLGKILAQLNE